MTGGHPFRFITTHLSAITLTAGVQAQQAQELLAGPEMARIAALVSEARRRSAVEKHQR